MSPFLEVGAGSVPETALRCGHLCECFPVPRSWSARGCFSIHPCVTVSWTGPGVDGALEYLRESVILKANM